jgi:hypothetical protein
MACSTQFVQIAFEEECMPGRLQRVHVDGLDGLCTLVPAVLAPPRPLVLPTATQLVAW